MAALRAAQNAYVARGRSLPTSGLTYSLQIYTEKESVSMTIQGAQYIAVILLLP